MQLEQFISLLEDKIGEKWREYMVKTYDDISNLDMYIDFEIIASIDDGLEKFSIWDKDFFEI